jgi:TP901 family phage tail tape measure protein
MPTASTTLEILVKLKDEASAAMQGLGANLQSVGQSMTSVGKTMTTDITLPLVAFGVWAAKGAIDFQQAMTLVQTQAGASATEVQSLSQQVMQLATVSEQGPTDLANGLYHLVSLGLNANDAFNALKIASEGAAVGQANLEEVTNALGGAISSGIKGTSNYSDAMATLNAIVGSGNMRMSDLTAALGTGILAAAKTAGMSIQDVGAALATMTDNGVPATDAATRLRMTFSLMAAPTKAAQTALEGIGLSQFALADDMRNKGLLPALQDLEDHLKSSGKTADEQAAIISKAFGGARTGTTIELLLQNLPRLGQKYTDISNGVKNFQVDVNVQANTWNAQLDNMNANLQVFRDTVGTSLLQIANEVLPIVISALKDLVTWWNDLSPGIQKAIIYAAMFAAAIGPVLIVIGTLVSALGSIITFLGIVAVAIGITTAVLLGWIAIIALVVAAVVALGYAVYTHWTQISETTLAIWGNIKTFIKTTWDWITALFNTSLAGIETVWDTVWGAVAGFFEGIWGGVKTSLTDALSFVRSEITAFVSWASGIFAPVLSAVNAIGGAASGFGKVVGGAVSSIIPKFASGGIVNSPTIGLIGEAGPEAIIPLSAFSGGSSLAGKGGGGAGNIIVNINGGYYLDQQAAKQIGDNLAKQIVSQIRVKNYAF